MHCVLCRVCNVQRRVSTVYSAHLRCVQCRVSTVYAVRICAVYSAECALCTVQSVYCVQCAFAHCTHRILHACAYCLFACAYCYVHVFIGYTTLQCVMHRTSYRLVYIILYIMHRTSHHLVYIIPCIMHHVSHHRCISYRGSNMMLCITHDVMHHT